MKQQSQDDFLKLVEIAERLKDKYIIVEGKKDEKVLRNLGLQNIIKIGGRDLQDISLTLNHDKEIVILTDFDKAGKKLAARTNKILRAYKFKINSQLRKLFFGLGKSRVEDFNSILSLE